MSLMKRATAVAVTTMALGAGAIMTAPASQADGIFKEDWCMDRSRMTYVDANGWEHGYYRIKVPGDGACNDIYIKWTRKNN